MKKGNPLHSDIARINRNQTNFETFNGNIGNIGHNQSAPVTCKNNVNISIKAASN